MKNKYRFSSLLQTVFPIAVVVIGVATIIGTGHSPRPPASRITQFTATPTIVCPGESVTLSWAAEGTSATLSGNAVALSGSTTVTPEGPRNSSYELSIDSGAARGVIRINVITFGESVNLQLLPVCVGGVFQNSWSGDFNFPEIITDPIIFSSLIKVDTVSQTWDRAVIVSHDGISARINRSPASSTAWNNNPPTGPWTAVAAPGITLRRYSCPGPVNFGGTPAPGIGLDIVLKCP